MGLLHYHTWSYCYLPVGLGEGSELLSDGSSAALLQSEVAALRLQISHLEGAEAEVDTLLAENGKLQKMLVGLTLIRVSEG